MRSVSTGFLLAIVVLAMGCVPSLHPLYTDSDLTTDPTLVGTWLDRETRESWTFSSREKFKYSIVHVDSEAHRSEYEARLVKVGDRLFLDIVPTNTGLPNNGLYGDQSSSTHTFVHLERKKSSIQISYMEPRWLKDHLADHPDSIRHEKIGGEIVLTSSPGDTQKFVLEHLETRGAFSTPVEITRKRGGS